jgi:hypothetical protein
MAKEGKKMCGYENEKGIKKGNERCDTPLHFNRYFPIV